ncbi:MAG: DsbA family protein [Candidatus Binatia bacterium]
MRTLAIAVLAVVAIAIGGCKESRQEGQSLVPGAQPADKQAAAKPAEQPAGPGAETLATAGNQTIRRADVETMMRTELAALEAERYKVMRGGVDELVARALFDQEAAARGITSEQLQQTEITGKIPPPSDADVQKLYDDNREQMFGRTLDSVKGDLVSYLQRRSAQARTEAFVAELKQKYPTKIALRPPKVDIGVGSTPAKGPADAPVTVIEFSDYECPYCKSSQPAVQQMLADYGDKVRFAHRHYPLPFHPHAAPAAEAAMCANEQGKFWDYHEKLMAASDLSQANLQQLATDTGLDRTQFDQCVTIRKFRDAVQEDIAAGEAVGVNGTPAFFINGRLLDGAQSLPKFKQVIDEELEYGGQS